MRSRWALVTLTIIFLFWAGTVYAEEVKKDSASAQPQAGEEKIENKITLDLKGVEINELFKMLSEKSGMTVITTPEVKGRITVFMDNLTFTDALDVIVTMQDLAYETKGKIYVLSNITESEIAKRQLGTTLAEGFRGTLN